jgi:hypothetical protein
VAGTSETICKLDTLRMIVAKFGSNWFSGFRKRKFDKNFNKKILKNPEKGQLL